MSNNVTINDNGHIKLTTELIKDLQQLITEAGFDYQLDTDVSPKFVVGYVETKEKHPNADKLSVLNVNVGTEKLQIVLWSSKCRIWSEGRCCKSWGRYAKRNGN